MIRLSYFGNIYNLDLFPNKISIARITPKWFDGNVYLPLAPPWELVAAIKSGKITEDEYIKQYKKILMSLDVKKVVRDLGDNPVLLCYEKPPKFCHRQIVGKWLRYYGYECEEYTNGH